MERNVAEVVRVQQQAQSEEASVKAIQELVAQRIDCIIHLVGRHLESSPARIVAIEN